MKYDHYIKGAASAVKAFNVPKPAQTTPANKASTGKSHLLNPGTDADQRRVTDPPFVNQQDRAYSLAQQAMNHAMKLGLDASKRCGTCKEPQHYGNCKSRTPFIRTELRVAQFNRGMHGSDSDTPLKYTPATGDSAKTRARQATLPRLDVNTAHNTFSNDLLKIVSDESEHAYGALNKTADELRGPTVNPYSERPQILSRPSADNKTQEDLIAAMLRSFDIPSDAAGVDNVTPQDDVLI